MDDGLNTDLFPVYIGTNRPDLFTYTVGGLTTGLPYRFSVQAMNDNGKSTQSDLAIFYSCSSPKQLVAPLYVSSDQDLKTISISWVKPVDDGGCPVLGYHLYRDDGSDGSDVDIELTGLANDNPSLTSYTEDLSGEVTALVGMVYQFKVKAYNYAGSVLSSALSVALASLPSKPTSAPTAVASDTNQNQIRV